MDDDRPHSDLEKRVRRLESLQRQLVGIVAVILLAVGLFVVWVKRLVATRIEGRTRFETVEAGHFVVRDTTGHPRAELGMNLGMPRLIIGADELRKPGVFIASGGLGPQIILKDSAGPKLMITSEPLIALRTDERIRSAWFVYSGAAKFLAFDSSGRARSPSDSSVWSPRRLTR